MRNILIAMPNWIGDCVMATSLLENLFLSCPNDRISLLVRKPLDALFEKDSRITSIFPYTPIDSLFKRRWEPSHLVPEMRSFNFDITISLTRSLLTRWLLFCTKAPLRIGYGYFLLTCPQKKSLEPIHERLFYEKLLTPLLLPPKNLPPKLIVTEEEKKKAQNLLRELEIPQGAKIIAFNPGAAFGQAKCWPAEKFAQLALNLLSKEKNLHILIIGDSSCRTLGKNICQNLDKRAINLAGETSLRELLALLTQIDLLVTNDSGPMHLADALGCPLIALFGSTSPEKTGPLHGKVICKKASCSPCFKKKCPIDFRCMHSISVKEVYEEILLALHAQSS